MIKRRFYKFEHGDRDAASESSSSSSDSELEAEPAESTEESEDDTVVEVKENEENVSSGYEREDSSGNEVDVDSAGLVNEDDKSEDDRQIFIRDRLSSRHGAEKQKKKFNATAEKESLPEDFPACILKYKSVFKCKLCPRVLCLSEEIVRTHLKSKRHSRSEKLLKEGRLKAMLNSDGEIEEQEIALETHAPVNAVGQDKQKKKQKGHRRRKGPRRKRSREEKQLSKDGANKRHKNDK